MIQILVRITLTPITFLIDGLIAMCSIVFWILLNEDKLNIVDEGGVYVPFGITKLLWKRPFYMPKKSTSQE